MGWIETHKPLPFRILPFTEHKKNPEWSPGNTTACADRLRPHAWESPRVWAKRRTTGRWTAFVYDRSHITESYHISHTRYLNFEVSNLRIWQWSRRTIGDDRRSYSIFKIFSYTNSKECYRLDHAPCRPSAGDVGTQAKLTRRYERWSWDY